MKDSTLRAYELAKKMYAEIGVDTDKAIEMLDSTPISIQCWQADDIQGFISQDALSGGIQVTGNYPGKARNFSEVCEDLEKVFSLVPGKKRVNIHAIYPTRKLEGRDVDALEPEDFDGWIEFAKKNSIGVDFNPTFFSHKMHKDEFTLSSPDDEVRSFWVRHGQASVKIADHIGKELGDKCVTNIWVPDGMKDEPYSHIDARRRLADSLDKIISTPYSKDNVLLAVESKFFGIGVESYTVGSSEFYLGYAAKNQIGLCLDAGHFHPNEFISDKISSALLYVPELLLHVSRPVNWDSDHVVTDTDELNHIMQALVRDDLLSRTHIGLDFFDATINRIAAYVVGIRSTQKALLKAFLEPTDKLLSVERSVGYTERLAAVEELKGYPWGAVYNYYLEKNGIPTTNWIEEVKTYEKTILAKRGN